MRNKTDLHPQAGQKQKPKERINKMSNKNETTLEPDEVERNATPRGLPIIYTTFDAWGREFIHTESPRYYLARFRGNKSPWFVCDRHTDKPAKSTGLYRSRKAAVNALMKIHGKTIASYLPPRLTPEPKNQ
jgi:hypothetical protein